MKPSKYILVLLFLPILAFAQSYTLQGKIRELKDTTGNPIANVRVDLDSSSYIAKTDAVGNYVIANVAEGNHRIRFDKIGYRGFDQVITITSDITVNVSMPETTQTNPKGTGVLSKFKLIRLFLPNDVNDGNPYFWLSTPQNPVAIFLSSANSQDSLQYQNAIGTFDMNNNYRSGSLEWGLERKMFLPTKDSVYCRNNGVMLIFHGFGNFSEPFPNSQDLRYFKKGRSYTRVNDVETIQHEIGWELSKNLTSGLNDIDSTFRSNMELAAELPLTLDDFILTRVYDNHKLATFRDEQNVGLLNMSNFDPPTMPIAPSIVSPVNNSTGVPLNMNVTWSNIFGADTYHLQIATDSLFNSKIVDDSLLQRIVTLFTASVNTKYYLRVRSKNNVGTSEWSIIINSTALPVELVSFTGAYRDNSVRLNWKTATEINNYGFNIEKTSAQTLGWNTIGFVQGHGTINSPQEYSFIDNVPHSKGIYRLKQIDRDGKFEYSNTIEITPVAPLFFSLLQNYPNPFNPVTTIRYGLPQNCNVSLKIYNVIGEQVANLVQGEQSAGWQNITWNANVSTGLYFYRLEAIDVANPNNRFYQVKKMMLLK